MFRNFLLVLCLTTILVADNAVGLPQGGWMSGLFGNRETPAQITNTVSEATNEVAPPSNVNLLINDLKKNAGNVAVQLNEMKDEGMKALGDTTQKLGGIIEAFKSVAGGDSVKQITGHILGSKEQLEKVGQDVKNLFVNQAGKPISEQLKLISNNVGLIFGKLGTAIGGVGGGSVMVDIGQHIGNAVDEINTAINGKSVQKIINTVNSLSGKLGNAVGEIGAAVASGKDKPIGEYIGNIGKSAMGAMSQVATIVGGEDGKKLINDIGKQVDSTVQQVNSVMQNVDKLASMAGEIGNHVGQATGEVKSFVKNAGMKDALDIVNSNKDSLTKLGTSLWGYMG